MKYVEILRFQAPGSGSPVTRISSATYCGTSGPFAVTLRELCVFPSKIPHKLFEQLQMLPDPNSISWNDWCKPTSRLGMCRVKIRQLEGRTGSQKASVITGIQISDGAKDLQLQWKPKPCNSPLSPLFHLVQMQSCGKAGCSDWSSFWQVICMPAKPAAAILEVLEEQNGSLRDLYNIMVAMGKLDCTLDRTSRGHCCNCHQCPQPGRHRKSLEHECQEHGQPTDCSPGTRNLPLRAYENRRLELQEENI
ncbi:UNC5C-like protein [Pangshura tecta]